MSAIPFLGPLLLALASLLVLLNPSSPFMAQFSFLAMFNLLLYLLWTLPDVSGCALPPIYTKSLLLNHTLE